MTVYISDLHQTSVMLLKSLCHFFVIQLFVVSINGLSFIFKPSNSDVKLACEKSIHTIMTYIFIYYCNSSLIVSVVGMHDKTDI